MGAQIAQQGALWGYEVRLTDSDPAQLQRAVNSNRGHLQRRVDKGTLSAEAMQEALGLVQPMADLADAAGAADFVIEAVVEQLEVKRGVFAALEAVCRPRVVLASNSSTIAISQIVDGLANPRRAINMHFFHPVLVMQLVEVMRGRETADETVSLTMEMALRIGKEPVLINREIYGLLVNRILSAIKREAFWLAEEGYATPEDIDRAVRLGLNHPMGPFQLTDFSGLDVFYDAALQRYRETGDPQYKPPRILEELVRKGHLGRKTGRGFYDYSGEDRVRP
jgi:3-hydroxybutyryl-CoA dehydrogenase